MSALSNPSRRCAVAKLRGIARGCRPRDLRFAPAEEAEFHKHLHNDVVVSCLWCAVAILVCLTASAGPGWAVERSRADSRFKWSKGDPRSVYFGAVSVCALILILAVIACLARRLCKAFSCLNFENVAIIIFLAILATNAIANKFFSSALLGRVPEETWQDEFTPEGAEVIAILCIIGAVMGACQACPIRTHLMWIVPFTGAIIYPIMVFAIGTTMPGEANRIAIAVAFFSAFSYKGARRNEMQVRQKWRAIQESAERDRVAQGLEALSWMSCDVVIRLGADTCVVESSARLRSFFGQCMQGSRLTEIMQEDDKEAYDVALRTAAQTGELQSLPVTFELDFAQLRAHLAVVFVNGLSTRFVLGVSQVEHAPKIESSGPELLDTIDEEAESAAHATRPRSAPSTDCASMLTSTATERVFNDVERLCQRWALGEGSGSIRGALQHIAEVGVREHWLVGTQEVKLLYPTVVCGTGGFGCVAMGFLRGSPVAIKVPRARAAPSSAKLVASFCNEIRLLRRVRHSHIVAFHGAAIDPASGDMAMIFELVGGRSMSEFVMQVHRDAAYEKREVALIKALFDVSSALMYLHATEPAIVHGDVKGSNIRVEDRTEGVVHATLLDLGLSRLLTKRAMPLGGTRVWMAPELFSHNAGSARPAPSADVYSFGLLTHFAMTGVRADRSFDAANAPGRFARLAWPQSTLFGAECRALSMDCLRTQPAKRPLISEVHTTLIRWIHSTKASYEELGHEVVCQFATVVDWDRGMQELRAPDTPDNAVGCEPTRCTEAPAPH